MQTRSNVQWKALDEAELNWTESWLCSSAGDLLTHGFVCHESLPHVDKELENNKPEYTTQLVARSEERRAAPSHCCKHALVCIRPLNLFGNLFWCREALYLCQPRRRRHGNRVWAASVTRGRERYQSSLWQETFFIPPFRHYSSAEQTACHHNNAHLCPSSFTV